MAQDAKPAASAADAKPAAGDQYQAVGMAPELQSGEMLLVEAYAAFWLVLLVFVGVMFVRTKKMEGQIATLVTALSRARERDDAARGATRQKAAASSETPDTEAAAKDD